MPRIINLPTFTDKRGNLTVYDTELPFIPKRVFWIWGVPKDHERANHAHEICEQIIIPLAGEFVIEVDDGNKYYLKCHTGLYVETERKIRLYDFSDDALCLVLASEGYDSKETMTKTELFKLISEIREGIIDSEDAEKTLLYVAGLLE